MIRDILKYPNNILRDKCVDIDDFNDDLHLLLDDMYETMLEDNGVGLAAIQIGILKNIFIINMPDDQDAQSTNNLIEVINPQIIKQENEDFTIEGCLSVPGFNAKIKRFQNISVSYQNRYGDVIEEEFTDYDAVAWQHELDHLNGVLFIDRLSILDKQKFKKHLRKEKKKEIAS